MAITYAPTTNFGLKDSLPTNDSDKVIRGSEFTTEFTAIQTAFSLAAPTASPTFTGTVTIPTADINGGAIDGTTIGGTTPAAATFTSVTATTADINGGNIDGTVIGAATPAAGSFTTGQFGTSLNVDGTVTADGLTVDGVIESSGGTSIIYLMETDAVDKNTYLRSGSGGIFTIRTVSDDKSTSTTRFGLDHSTGAISFYEDTGTTPKFFWDASAESLGIGTTSPSSFAGYSTVGVNGSTGGIYDVFVGGTRTATLVGTSSQTSLRTLTSSPLAFYTDSAERMRIDSSGNLGLGVTPSAWLSTLSVLQFGGAGGIWSSDSATNNTSIGSNIYYNSSSQPIYIGSSAATQYQQLTGAHIWYTAPTGTAGNTISFTQAMTLDASGNLLVGKTSASLTGEGVVLRPTSSNLFTRDDGLVMALNRTTTDGDIVEFYKDGSTVGSIGSNTGVYLEGAAGGFRVHSGGAKIFPSQSGGAVKDAAIDLGATDARWKDLYLSGGVYLGGTGAANLLDDYEEGTFTVTLTCASGTITLDSNINEMAYTKVGRQVTITGRVRISAVSSPTGFVNMNLPFTSANLTDQAEYSALNFLTHDVNIPAGAIQLFAEVGTSGNTARLNYTASNAAWTTFDASNFDGSGNEYIYVTGTFLTD